VSPGSPINKINDESFECPGCLAVCTETVFGAIYVPPDENVSYHYMLCDACAEKLLLGEESKQAMFATVELRLGKTRGRA
jgi:C4-type Zn-finger protein